MMNKKTIKKVLFFGLITAAVLLIPFELTRAQDPLGLLNLAGQSVISVASWAISTMLFVVGYFFSKVVFLGGIILNWVFDLNSDILNNPVIEIGWTITRDIANLGFVLLIIIIAFSTILRMGGFQMKQTLPKLIIAALLINFSILIAAVFLDVAGVFTNFFLGSAYSQSGQGGISQAIAGSLSLHSFLQTPEITSAATLTTFSAETVKFIANLIFIDIMTAIGAITMITMAAMFLIRYMMIGILLILMPGAILMWVIGNKLWGEWWNTFFKYTFFGPICGFFIYVALKSAMTFENMAGAKFSFIEGDTSGIGNLAKSIGSMIMMVGLLMGGLMAAEKLSIMGAKTGLAVAQGAVKGILKGTAATALTGTGLGWLAKKASTVGATSKYGLVRGITRPLRQIGKTGAEFKKEYGGLTGIMTATSEGISGGFGFGARKLRLKEEKEYKKYEEQERKKEERKKKIELKEKETETLVATLKTRESDLAQEKLKPTIDQNKIKSFQDEIETIRQKIKKGGEELESIKKEPEKEEGELKEEIKETIKEEMKKMKGEKS